MIIQWAELSLLLLLMVTTGGLGWALYCLVRSTHKVVVAHGDEQARLINAVASLAATQEKDQEKLTARLDALDERLSDIAGETKALMVELTKARDEAVVRHDTVIKEITAAVSATRGAEERLKSAIDGFAASQRRTANHDKDEILAALGNIAFDVRSLKPEIPIPLDIHPQEWVLDSLEHPAVRVSLIKESESILAPTEEKRALLPERVSSYLTNVCQSLFGSAVLQSIPGMVVAADGLIRTRVVFTPEVMVGLANGTFRHVQAGDGRWLAVAYNVGTGQIAEIGRIVTGLNPIAVIGMVWQIATFVTAQHHLANIHRELSGLRRQISNIEVWLASKEMGSLQGDFAYLDQIDHFLSTGAISHAELPLYLGKIEAMERSSLASYNAAKIRIQASRNELEPLIKEKKSLGNAEAFHDKLKRYEDDCSIITASLFVRVRAGNTHRLLSLNPAVTQHRKGLVDDARKELAELTTDFCKAMDEVSPEPSWFQMPEAKQKFHERNNDTRERVQASIEKQLQSLDDFQTRLGNTGIAQEALTFECAFDPKTQSIHTASQIGTPTYAEEIGDEFGEDAHRVKIAFRDTAIKLLRGPHTADTNLTSGETGE